MSASIAAAQHCVSGKLLDNEGGSFGLITQTGIALDLQETSFKEARGQQTPPATSAVRNKAGLCSQRCRHLAYDEARVLMKHAGDGKPKP